MHDIINKVGNFVNESTSSSLTEADELISQIISNLSSVILTNPQIVEVIVAALISRNHILLEDKPGVGKTVLAKAVAKTFDLDFSRIQGTVDLLPSDITGSHIFNPQKAEFQFQRGPIFASLILIDELNRATPKAQSALLEAMAETQVTVEGETFTLPQNFTVIATQNPHQEAGTYPLVNAQLDRFAVQISLGLPSLNAEKMILKGEAGDVTLNKINKIIGLEELSLLYKAANEIHLSDNVLDYMLSLVNQLRESVASVWLSVRVSQLIAELAKSLALVKNRTYVTPEDIQTVLPYIVRHRLPSGFDHSIIESAVSTTPIPANEV